MANQLNFPDPLPSTVPARPQRVAREDLDLTASRDKQFVFGTDAHDVVEMWAYNPDGSFAGHVTMDVPTPALSHITLVDNTGPYEVLDLNLTDICAAMGMQPGRYTFVANFFRNEVGGETGQKLYIADISDDRTEVLLKPVFKYPELIREIYEFVVPSVPQRLAQALIDQTLRASLDYGDTESVSVSTVGTELDRLRDRTTQRIAYSGTSDIYGSMLTAVVNRTRELALDLMAADAENRNVQQADLNQYVNRALEQVISDVSARGELDPRFIFV